MLATTLTVSLVSALAPLPALAAQPISQTAVEMVQHDVARSEATQRQVVDGTIGEVMKDMAGHDLKARGPQCVDSDPRCRADFDSLTPEGQDAYRKMPFAAKQIMSKQLNGSYKILFIPVVNYRNAFIKGEAFGKNVFNFATDQINKKEKEGVLTAANAHHARWFLQISSRMSSAQRAALVRIINQDARLGATPSRR
jgi:hypothetical protein